MSEFVGQNSGSYGLNNQEREAVFARMRGDVGLPSRSGYRNRFADVVRSQSAIDEINYPNGLPEYMTGKLLRRGDLLVAWNMVELVAAYQKYRKREPVPDNPADFFQALERAKDWTFSQFGITRSDMLTAKDRFWKAAEILDENTPTLWIFARELDVLETGYGLSNPSDIDNLVRAQFQSHIIPQSVFKGSTIGYLILIANGFDLDGTFKGFVEGDKPLK
ncbi:MAG: hypothetical protein G01um10147_726 [Microgenomates group bacterium Gr01-1014_7]|nr:MAG: hypothetical protein G01um10147_726 [Microgenomates group bacterium Gr01-1014_7]